MDTSIGSRRFPAHEPQTIIGQWVRASALDRKDVRNRFLEEIKRTGGFTLGRVEVVLQTFSAATERWWSSPAELYSARAMVSQFVEHYREHHTFDPVAVESLIRVTWGEAMLIDVLPELRFLICCVFFWYVCNEAEIPQSVIDELIQLGESRAVSGGFEVMTQAEVAIDT